MRRWQISMISAIVAVGGCAAPYGRLSSSYPPFIYPLPHCTKERTSTFDQNCRVAFFRSGADIGRRDQRDFPQRYLELYDPAVREAYCSHYGYTEPDCLGRLSVISEYFNPFDHVPDDNEIGVALEGGGTKAAAFSLGAMAGLQQLGLMDSRVTAISSISGGTYAASYFFNRWFDRLRDRSYQSNMEEWFHSCVPSYFILRGLFQTMSDAIKNFDCGEKTLRGGVVENSTPVPDREYFKSQYRYIGHVWTNHDLLGGDTPGNLTTKEDLGTRAKLHVAQMAGETFLTTPVQFLFRTVFRWPINTAPSKLYYKLGLEREYGYSPRDWAGAGQTDFDHLRTTLSGRCGTRTLARLGNMIHTEGPVLAEQSQRIPRWIIGSAAPGSLGPTDWLFPVPRDPVRLQFELTWDGYGSGVYGYALRAPDTFLDFCGERPDGLPIVDAVVASAAFFDDSQSLISQQPARFLADAAQHFLNLTWFTDLKNFNVSDDARYLYSMLPYPLYFTQSTRWNETPYIHLQDGGNVDNTGIFPLLRRGYKRIVYVYGTLDRTAQWSSICHLKNQLELDGTYSLVSPALDRITTGQKIKTENGAGREFPDFLNGLCASQMDGSDLAVFGGNASSDHAHPAINRVASLYCERLGYRMERSVAPCKEYLEKFVDSVPEKIPDFAQQAFFHWPAGTVVTFEVYHRGEETTESPLSTIVAIVPGISFADFSSQLTPDPKVNGISNWEQWCLASSTLTRKSTTIAQCIAPDGKLQSQWAQAVGTHNPALPCNALAHLVEDQCVNVTAQMSAPSFPQDDFVKMTLHTTYTLYAAYFDLARNQIEDVLCGYHDRRFARPARCPDSQTVVTR